MQATELLRAGKLQEALADLQKQVRQEPASAKHRIFLFQILAVLGDWDRALTQLNVAGELDAGALAMVQTYREALRCEVLRRDVFAGRRTPLLFGEPQEWMALLVESFRLGASGETAPAAELRARAFDAAPASPGRITIGDGPEEPFAWIADADSRLGPMLEAIVNGRYYWVPFHRIETLAIEPPQDLRDIVWMPAYFQWTTGGETVGLIPTRYAGSETSGDDEIRLARKTDWLPAGPEVTAGIGQRMLATDAGEYALMDVRKIAFDHATPLDGGPDGEETAGG